MLKNILLVTCAFLLFTSCKTISLNTSSLKSTTQQVDLGSIGLDKDFILQKEYKNSAIPNYKKPLKLSVTVIPFYNQTYKAFTKASALLSTPLKVNYMDSIEDKPKFIKLQIADKVAVIEALNNIENNTVKRYLSNNNHTNIITSISIALNQKDIEHVITADAVFLIESGLKTYALQLHKNKIKTLLPFNQGVVFGYQTSNCCWQENKKHSVDIVDLATSFNNCPNNTYRSSKRAEKKMETIKF